MLNTGMRLWRTVRCLRPTQIVGRAWLRLHRPKAELSPPPDVRPVYPRWKGCTRRASLTAPDTLRLLNVEHRIAGVDDWSNIARPKLWLYNAHYFDDLVAADALAREAWHRTLVARWIRENPAAGGVGWEPYPTSVRIVNWVKWAWSGHLLDAAVVHSLAVQVRWLRKRLEWHLLGNHLWANAKALVFVGVFFDGREARGWLEKGLALIDHELREQVLPDGGHFERSPMYHAIVLEDLLDLVQLGRLHPQALAAAPTERWSATAERMLAWLQAMSHPDGGIAFFNDAAFDIAPTVADLATYAGTLGLLVGPPLPPGMHALPQTGYLRLQGSRTVLIVDVAPIGPDYLPGHAHADTLSFEWSLDGERVLVNGGTSTYESGDERARQRGTGMHNTVQIDGEDSSEVWASFRVARRARVKDVAWGTVGDELDASASHDGYARLPGRPRHAREWRLAPGRLTVHDTIHGRYSRAVARFRLHPRWRAGIDGSGIGWLQAGDRRIRWTASPGATVDIRDSTWHPRFGESRACQVLEIDVADGILLTTFEFD